MTERWPPSVSGTVGEYHEGAGRDSKASAFQLILIALGAIAKRDTVTARQTLERVLTGDKPATGLIAAEILVDLIGGQPGRPRDLPVGSSALSESDRQIVLRLIAHAPTSPERHSLGADATPSVHAMLFLAELASDRVERYVALSGQAADAYYRHRRYAVTRQRQTGRHRQPG